MYFCTVNVTSRVMIWHIPYIVGFWLSESLSKSSESHRAMHRVSRAIHNEFHTPKAFLSFWQLPTTHNACRKPTWLLGWRYRWSIFFHTAFFFGFVTAVECLELDISRSTFLDFIDKTEFFFIWSAIFSRLQQHSLRTKIPGKSWAHS